MKQQTFFIRGMHCRSCEILIEDGIKELKNVKAVTVDHQTGTAQVDYRGHLDKESIQSVVEQAGYSLGKPEKVPFISTKREDWNQLSKAAMVVIGLYLLGRWLGIFSFGGFASDNYSSLPVVFLVGLTAGVSTCMALVGGLVLGVSAQFAKQKPLASATEKFTPHLFFNLGRIISFLVLGGIVGWLGSILQMSLTVTGLLTILVGLSMLIIGAQLIDVFPRLTSWQFTLPKSISRLLGIDAHKQAAYSHSNSMILGGMTFFLPCGFTQAMQLFAMSTGSLIEGALTMGVFALGTAPGLLTVGGLTSIIKGKSAQYFFKFSGLVVLALALFNIANGLRLTGVESNLLNVVSSRAQGKTTVAPTVGQNNGVQVIKMTQNANGYSPNSFTIKKGIKVRWIVTSTEPYSCASSLVSKKLNIRQALKSGENIIEFTPTETGKIAFSCSMGMYAGSFTVID